MVLVLATVVAGVLVGYARGGRLANLGNVDLHYGWLVVVAVVAQLLPALVELLGLPAEGLSTPLLVVSHVALLGFVVANRMLAGMFLVFAGFAMNALVITANGAMPVAPGALREVSGGSITTISPGKHRLLEEGDRLTWLADIFPLPVLRTVVSAGDIVLAAGVGILVANLMLRHPRRRSPERSPAEPVDGGAESLP